MIAPHIEQAVQAGSKILKGDLRSKLQELFFREKAAQSREQLIRNF